MSSFKMNPNVERDLTRQVVTNLLPQLKREVEQVADPEHPGADHHATVVADPNTGWKIVGGCDAISAAALDRLVAKGLVKRT